MIKIQHINHSGFVVTAENCVIIIDFYKDTGGILSEVLKQARKLYVISSHRHPDHFTPEIFKWNGEHVRYILSNDIKKKYRGEKKLELPDNVTFINRGETYDDGCLQIEAFGSTDVGVSFLLKIDNKTIFHAGDLNDWRWEHESTEQEMKEARKSFLSILKEIKKKANHMDVAMFPVDTRMQGDYACGARQFVREFEVGAFIPMHTWGDWEKACDFTVYKNDNFGKYICLRDGECVLLE